MCSGATRFAHSRACAFDEARKMPLFCSDAFAVGFSCARRSKTCNNSVRQLARGGDEERECVHIMLGLGNQVGTQ